MSPALLALALSLAAQSDPCESGLAQDPIGVGFRDGSFSIPRRACTRTEVALGGTGDLIAEPSQFYGNLRVAGTLAGSWEPIAGTEIFGQAELIRYQTVISSLSADHLGLGLTALGATHRWLDGDGWLLSATSRITLPTATGLYQRSWPFAVDLGLAGASRATEEIALHGYLGLLASAATSTPDPRAGVLLDAGASWRPAGWFALAADVEGEVLYRSILDHVALALGFRFFPGDDLAIELALKSPIAGSERTLVAAFFGVTHRL
jgi:hypothetical protein